MNDDTACPNCGDPGRLATNHSLDWYKCPQCREIYEVDHTICGHSGCTAWADEEGYCWYHLAQQGIYPDAEPFQADHAREDKE